MINGPSQEHRLDLTYESHRRIKLLPQSRYVVDFSKYLATKKHSLNHALSGVVVPAAVDAWRHIWEAEGRRNLTAIIDYIQRPGSREDQFLPTRQSTGWELLFGIFANAKPLLSRKQKRKILNYCKFNKCLFLFDSYSFFSSGHAVCLYQTIEAISAICGNTCFVILYNHRLVLMPEILEALEATNKNLIAIDLGDFNLCFDGLVDSRIFDEHTCMASCLAPVSSVKSTQRPDIVWIRKTLLNPSAFLHNSSYFGNCLDVETAKKASPWINLYKPEQSISLLRECIGYCLDNSLPSQYICVHERTPDFRWPSVRDSGNLKQRAILVDFLENCGIHIFVLGIVPDELRYLHQNVTYLCELAPAHSSLQLNLINGSRAMLGAMSGISHLAALTETPMIVMDCPFPLYPWRPKCYSKLLLKTIFRNRERASPSDYYKFPFSEYLESDSASPLLRAGYKFSNNSDLQLCLALASLFSECYGDHSLKEKYVDQFGELPIVPEAELNKIETAIYSNAHTAIAPGLTEQIASAHVLDSANWIWD